MSQDYNGYVSKAAYLESVRQTWLGLAHDEERRAGAITQEVLDMEAKAARLLEEIRREQAHAS